MTVWFNKGQVALFSLAWLPAVCEKCCFTLVVKWNIHVEAWLAYPISLLVIL